MSTGATMPKDIEDCMEEMNPQDKDAPMAVKGEAVPETSPAITIRKDLNKTPNGSTAAGFKNRTRLILACVVVTLLAAFGAVLGLYVAKDEDQTDCDDKASEDLPDENTTAPNENPFLEDPKLARLYSILEPIASSGFYTKDPDDEEDLPEYKAWAWLSKRDMSLDTNRESTPDWKIVERYVLAAFFYATNGEEWDNTYGFLSNSPVCDWKEQNEFHYGVRFCSDEGSVTMLHIPANNLEGPIPTLLGLLINLVSLDLPGNSLAGTLPSELSKLTRLTGKLDLSRNLLTGTISSSIGRLVDLTELHLNENRLDGAIPTEIALMTSLTTLHLSSNQMTDGIPHELGRLDRLEDLRLDDNMLSGRLPSSLGNLSSIRKLHLHQNQLSGTVPSSFSQLQNRNFHSYDLHLQANKLTGSMDFLCSDNAFCATGVGCTADCVSEIQCSCCQQCYATAVTLCAKVSPSRNGCRIIMDDSLNEESSLLEAKNDMDPSSWHYNKDFPFQVTDDVDSDDPWTVNGWIDIQDLPIYYMPGIGVPKVNCSTLMLSDHRAMHNDDQLRFIELPDYPCTEFGKRLINFLIMEWFYFG